MAGPTITVAVLADTTKAVRGFDDVSKSAKGTEGDLDRAAGGIDQSYDRIADSAEDAGRRARRSSDDLGAGVKDLDGKASSAERGFRGFSDSLNGTGDVMAGLKSGNLVQLGMGLADLAGAVQDLILPLFKQMAVKLGLVTVATETQTGAQVASNTAMAANPIGIVVLALVALAAAFFIAWQKSETFREIVTGAFDAITGAAQATFGWIRDNWPLLLAIITGPIGLAVLAIVRHWDDIKAGFSKLKDGIATIASGVYEVIVAPFRIVAAGVKLHIEALKAVVTGVFDAIKAVIDGVRDAVADLIDKVKDAVNAVKGLPGAGIVSGIGGGIGGAVSSVGGVFGLASGGIVRARPGGTLVRVGEGGRDEAVVPLGAAGIGSTTIYYPAGYNRREVTDAQRRFTRLNPGP